VTTELAKRVPQRVGGSVWCMVMALKDNEGGISGKRLEVVVLGDSCSCKTC